VSTSQSCSANTSILCFILVKHCIFNWLRRVHCDLWFIMSVGMDCGFNPFRLPNEAAAALFSYGVRSQTIQSTVFISHLTNSNGCGNIAPKVLLTVSPSRPSFYPRPAVFSQRFNFCGQPGSVSHAVSYYCALLNSLAALFATPILCFQQFAHSFCKMPGVGMSLASRCDLRPLGSLCFHLGALWCCAFSRFGLLVPEPSADLE
jgi:hypothetical protein